ncbi:MAG: polyamine aminopropyltransferase [Candidatus Aminicenantes bacterium]
MKPAKALNAKKTEAREYQTAASGIFFTVKDVLYEGRSEFQRIEIIRNRDYGRVLLLDGLLQTTERDEFYYHEMLVHPALACHPRPSKVLIIGGGDGGALREVLRHPVVKAWLVEIDGRVIEACRRHFPWLKAALKDPRAELAVADGNVFIEEVREKFDVILVDSSDPVGPSTVLHEEAFYCKLKSRLNPGGVIAAQAGSLMLHQDSHAMKSVFLKKLFRHSGLYLGPVPTYPVGMWCYNFLSDGVDPLAPRRMRIPKGLKYYNAEIHRAAFALPNFLKDRLA